MGAVGQVFQAPNGFNTTVLDDGSGDSAPNFVFSFDLLIPPGLKLSPALWAVVRVFTGANPGFRRQAVDHWMTRRARVGRGMHPEPRTTSWKPLMSKSSPIAASASARMRWISMRPIMYDTAWPGNDR